MTPDQNRMLDELNKVLMDLNSWETQFVSSLDGLRDSPLTEKQADCLQKIANKAAGWYEKKQEMLDSTEDYGIL